MKIIWLIFTTAFSLYSQDGLYINANGAKFYYETKGSGEPLILLHYFSGNHAIWRPDLIDTLSKHYKIIIPDLRGHGLSSNPTKEFSHGLVAQDIYALLDKLGIKQVRAIGASTGAMTLLHMATFDSTRIKTMILIGGTPYFDDQYRKRVKSITTWETFPPDRLPSWKERHTQGQEQLDMLLGQWRSMAFDHDDMNFSPSKLAKIKCPTLIVHGDRDPYFNVNLALEMYNSIPNSFLWVFPNEYHLPNWSNLWSEQFLKVSKLFLTGEL